jgi:ribosomal-protein-alanine N-acetyltransferase
MVVVARYQVRPMTEADIAQVAEIERESFPTTWPRTAYRRELANRLARYLVVVDASREATPAQQERRRTLLSIIRRGEEPAPTSDYIIGYVGVWLMVDEAHIVAIAVRQDYRGRGIGELLLAESLDLAIEHRQNNVTLEVRRSNAVAQALYEKYRFLKVGVRRRYYSDNGEDAVIMSTPPIQSSSYTEHLAYLREQRQKRWDAGEDAARVND